MIVFLAFITLYLTNTVFMTTIFNIEKIPTHGLKYGLWCLTPLSTIYYLIRSTRKKSPTCRKSLTNLSNNVVSSTPHMSGNRTHNYSGDMH